MLIINALHKPLGVWQNPSESQICTIRRLYMSLNIDQIAEAFCGHKFAVTYPYMADEIKWNIVGREELVGREAVIDQCDKAAKFLETVSATITKLKIIRAETCVVVEGAAQFQDQENQTSSVASCDVFQFSDGRLVQITSYNVELNQP
jgi:SnoaL-like domain